MQVERTSLDVLQDGGDPRAAAVWEDIATVTVPARTKRKGIIGKALVEAGVRPEVGGEPLRVRVLDASSAAMTEVAAVQPEPQLRIGG